jgi:hypothetical protein
VLAANVVGQLTHHAFSPRGGFQLAADVLAHAPVKVDEFGIDRLKGALPGLLD